MTATHEIHAGTVEGSSRNHIFVNGHSLCECHTTEGFGFAIGREPDYRECVKCRRRATATIRRQVS